MRKVYFRQLSLSFLWESKYDSYDTYHCAKVIKNTRTSSKILLGTMAIGGKPGVTVVAFHHKILSIKRKVRQGATTKTCYK